MSTIMEDNDLVTLVVVFTVAPEEQEAHVEYLEGVAREHSQLEGFVSCAIHASEDGLRVAEYIQWRSRADLQAMMSSERGRAHVANPTFVVDAHPYRVVSVVEA